MASSGHFDPSQTYDGTRSSNCHFCYIGKKPFHQTGRQATNVRRYLWSKKHGPFGKELPVSEAPTHDATSGYSAFSSFPSHPPAKRVQSHIIHNNPRNLQPTLATIPTSIPPASPSPSHTRPALNLEVRPSPIPQHRNSPKVISQQPQPVASTCRRREELSPLPFPASQLFQRQDQWPIPVTREDPNTAIQNHDAVARLFRRVDRNSRDVSMYANYRTIPGTASEEMAENFAWY
ncbi:hypothetical protein O181_079258 [Austropuccinia psidii MF-1]|uniref:Uncharacterized protein n=1 Tax=Austropuccinia psidii MF-1 TaxID=1389203 RepID=A0A9Q3IFF6_9BASI|nr:hypothetical protein [Austropuccinia psidii MF-1]